MDNMGMSEQMRQLLALSAEKYHCGDTAGCIEILEDLVGVLDSLFQDTDTVEYRDFQSPIEEVLYRVAFEPAKTIVDVHPYPMWQIWYLLGAAYFEAGKTERSQAALSRALELDPVSSVTLFEMAEVYKILDLEKFRSLILDAWRWSYTPASLARIYRSLGFYACEKEQWVLAKACYELSKSWDDCGMVYDELAWIKWKAGDVESVPATALRAYFRSQSIPFGPHPDILAVIDFLLEQSDPDLDEYKALLVSLVQELVGPALEFA